MEFALIEKKGNVAYVTVNHPQKFNAVSTAVLQSLNEAMDAADKMEDVYCVVLLGAGEKAFIGGADIKEMRDFTLKTAFEYSRFGSMVLNKIYEFRVPVIAAINGYCLGGGLEVAAACDIRIAADNAVFAMPEVSLGITCGTGGTQMLPRIVGEAKAKELLLVCDRIDAAEALRIGLVNKVVPKESLMEAADAMALKIASNGPIAVARMKKCINVGQQTDYKTGNEHVNLSFASCFTTKDAKDALSAFINKTKLEKFSNE